ncbi:Metallo-hydrolase/oxidoreductase [Exidia glandulosa HHB12029]|uniref:Metallo-hydrolase/oxidoreductase n=1 Tax=Exidia glandulosa HHB12029 TaxID=1314781 RepID=A0A165FIX6_EXIGL|nr:Metallo-hydrolase/oxidoreductase [Exidia glandulosa HHB12029]
MPSIGTSFLRYHHAHFSVSALEAGYIVLAEKLYVTNADRAISRRCPSLSFLLTHSRTGKRVVCDLGIRKDYVSSTGYPPATQRRIARFFPLDVSRDVADSLRDGGLEPEEIEYVLISHLHFDHVGDPSVFPRATFLLGAGGRALLENGYPKNPTAVVSAHPLPEDPARTQWLDPSSGGWHPLGPFERTLDFFEDGSLYIVDAPGHVAGHINALVRTEGGWVYLAGDTAHDIRLMTGEREVLCDVQDGFGCAHANKDEAVEHMRRVHSLKTEYGVDYILAHAYGFEERCKEGYFPGRLF